MFRNLIGKTVLVIHDNDDNSWMDSIVTVKEVKTVGHKEFWGRIQPVKRPVVEYANGSRMLLVNFQDIFEVEELQADLLGRGDEVFRFIEFEKVKIPYALHDTYEFLYVIQNIKTNEIIKLQPENAMHQLCPTFRDFFKMKRD
ncbi:hypothetical protein X915_gp064 [Bacillus phage vB_BanS-Tsamsa]|uniref:Uncharacterized protein n=1 Tax=Bacillus phage vB_BanS-Tsamsa TaxID=1308863 RepID=U5J9Q3_9CAUD|nr:hypothetical protein X915_gp064 [Bacillus phage vB_BanS-Tsamsa]AGI11831.1 hypothetical protein [Bacillus phage vB_BanS-Tsamsa]